MNHSLLSLISPDTLSQVDHALLSETQTVWTSPSPRGKWFIRTQTCPSKAVPKALSLEPVGYPQKATLAGSKDEEVAGRDLKLSLYHSQRWLCASSSMLFSHKWLCESHQGEPRYSLLVPKPSRQLPISFSLG